MVLPIISIIRHYSSTEKIKLIQLDNKDSSYYFVTGISERIL